MWCFGGGDKFGKNIKRLRLPLMASLSWIFLQSSAIVPKSYFILVLQSIETVTHLPVLANQLTLTEVNLERKKHKQETHSMLLPSSKVFNFLPSSCLFFMLFIASKYIIFYIMTRVYSHYQLVGSSDKSYSTVNRAGLPIWLGAASGFHSTRSHILEKMRDN